MIALLLFLLLLALHSSNPQPQPKLRWRDLTQEEIDGWYSPFDQCMMDTTVFYKSPQEIKRTFCANESTRMKDGRMGFCRVGMGSNKKECSAPYSGRRSYRRGIDGYTNASSKPIIEAFMRFSETNTALVFLGDSTMTQKRSALECELLRESPRMRLNGTKSSRGVLPCHSKQSVYVPGISTLVDVHGVSFGPSSLSCVKVKRKVARPEDFYEVAKDVLHQINFVDGKNMFIVANFGLWFNSKKYFQKTTSPALRWLNDIAMIPQFKNKVYWHETMSQHWPHRNRTGYFDLELGKAKKLALADPKWTEDPKRFHVPGCCVEIEDFSAEADWRNAVVKEKLSTEKLSNIEIMPFADITKGVADMHVCSPASPKQDCTHYCYWPLLWQQFWHTINRHAQELI